MNGLSSRLIQPFQLHEYPLVPLIPYASQSSLLGFIQTLDLGPIVLCREVADALVKMRPRIDFFAREFLNGIARLRLFCSSLYRDEATIKTENYASKRCAKSNVRKGLGFLEDQERVEANKNAERQEKRSPPKDSCSSQLHSCRADFSAPMRKSRVYKHFDNRPFATPTMLFLPLHLL
jgi:hypothetical protein